MERWFVKKRKRQGEHDISHGDNLKQSPSQGKTATQAWHLIKHCKLRLQYSLMENQPRYLEATARLRVAMPTARRMQTAITAGDGTSSAAGFVAGRQPSSPRHTARNAGPMTVRSTRAAAARDRRGRTTSHFPKASSRLVASGACRITRERNQTVAVAAAMKVRYGCPPDMMDRIERHRRDRAAVARRRRGGQRNEDRILRRAKSPEACRRRGRWGSMLVRGGGCWRTLLVDDEDIPPLYLE